MGDRRMTSATWRIAAASSIGTSHVKQGSVCQDSHACRIMQDADGSDVVVLVASDGAGSATRADAGSDCACSTIVEAVEVCLAKGRRVASFTFDDARDWVDHVQRAIAYRAEQDGATERDYACTLLVAIIGTDAAAFLQIGDGAMVATDEIGEWSWIHWPQRGDYANSTYFVTEKNACNQMAFDVIARPIDDVAVFTDGIEPLVLHYATKTVHSPFFNAMLGPVLASTRSGLDRNLSTSLEKYLASPKVCERTDDDKTLILATRRNAAATTELA